MWFICMHTCTSFIPSPLIHQCMLFSLTVCLHWKISSKQICSVFLCFFFPTKFAFLLQGGFGSYHFLEIPTASPSPSSLVMFPHYFLSVFQCLWDDTSNWVIALKERKLILPQINLLLRFTVQPCKTGGKAAEGVMRRWKCVLWPLYHEVMAWASLPQIPKN